MFAVLIDDLRSILTRLDASGDAVCAAHVQLVLDTLEGRKQHGIPRSNRAYHVAENQR